MPSRPVVPPDRVWNSVFAESVDHLFIGENPGGVEIMFWPDHGAKGSPIRHVDVRDPAEIAEIARVFRSASRLPSEQEPFAYNDASAGSVAGFDVEVSGGSPHGADWGFSDSWVHLDSRWGPEIKALLEKYRAKAVVASGAG